MKRIILAAAITVVSMSAGAQSANVTIPVTVNVPDIIVMSRITTGYAVLTSANTTFLNANDFDWAKQVGGWGFFQFKVRSNRHFKVNATIASFSFSPAAGVGYNSTIDVNTGMNQSDFYWRLVDAVDGSGAIAPPAGSVHSPHHWNVFNTTGTPNVMDDCPNGGNQQWQMQFLANPLWKYTGGTYSASITITATQI